MPVGVYHSPSVCTKTALPGAPSTSTPCPLACAAGLGRRARGPGQISRDKRHPGVVINLLPLLIETVHETRLQNRKGQVQVHVAVGARLGSRTALRYERRGFYVPISGTHARFLPFSLLPIDRLPLVSCRHHQTPRANWLAKPIVRLSSSFDLVYLPLRSTILVSVPGVIIVCLASSWVKISAV